MNLAAPEIQAAINSVPTVPQGWPWSHEPRSFDPSSNYNPCATLSAVIITIEGATGSSPEQALLFHNGNYVGTGASKAYAFMSLNAAQTTDDIVALNYKDGRNVCTACPGPITTVRTAAALVCGSCGTELPPNSKFCNECGAAVTSASKPA